MIFSYSGFWQGLYRVDNAIPNFGKLTRFVKNGCGSAAWVEGLIPFSPDVRHHRAEDPQALLSLVFLSAQVSCPSRVTDLRFLCGHYGCALVLSLHGGADHAHPPRHRVPRHVWRAAADLARPHSHWTRAGHQDAEQSGECPQRCTDRVADSALVRRSRRLYAARGRAQPHLGIHEEPQLGPQPDRRQRPHLALRPAGAHLHRAHRRQSVSAHRSPRQEACLSPPWNFHRDEVHRHLRQRHYLLSDLLVDSGRQSRAPPGFSRRAALRFDLGVTQVWIHLAATAPEFSGGLRSLRRLCSVAFLGIHFRPSYARRRLLLRRPPLTSLSSSELFRHLSRNSKSETRNLFCHPLVHPIVHCLVPELAVLRLEHPVAFVGEIQHLRGHTQSL